MFQPLSISAAKTVRELIDVLDYTTLYEICERYQLCNMADATERSLRATVLDDYENGLLSGREIRETCDDIEAERASQFLAVAMWRDQRAS